MGLTPTAMGSFSPNPVTGICDVCWNNVLTVINIGFLIHNHGEGRAGPCEPDLVTAVCNLSTVHISHHGTLSSLSSKLSRLSKEAPHFFRRSAL